MVLHGFKPDVTTANSAAQPLDYCGDSGMVLAPATSHATDMKLIDITGMKFQRWTVIGPQRLIVGGSKWLCRCECGVEREVKSASLRRGLSTSCGCRQKELAANDITGSRFGRLVVKDRAGSTPNSATWNCVCDCGNTTTLPSTALKSGNTRSCGCLKKESIASIGKKNLTHGKSSTPTYKSWAHMLARCRNPKDARYNDYGGRGVKVCERWDSFGSFLADMGEAPAGKTIDRKDVNGNYEPSNCRWATDTEQARNTRSNRILFAFGEQMTLAAWSEKTGINEETISSRIKRGWTVERSLSEPVTPKGSAV